MFHFYLFIYFSWGACPVCELRAVRPAYSVHAFSLCLLFPPLTFREGSDCSWPSYLYSLFTNPFRLGLQHYTAHASLMSNKHPFLVDAFNQTKKRQTSGRQNLRLQNPPKNVSSKLYQIENSRETRGQTMQSPMKRLIIMSRLI